MVLEGLLAISVTLAALFGLGILLLRPEAATRPTGFLEAFVLGSAASGLAAFACSHIGLFTRGGAAGILVLGAIAGIWGQRRARIVLGATWVQIRDGWRDLPNWLKVAVVAGLALAALLCGTPERSADALRYHVAQLKDMIDHAGWVYRPYYCHNFPQYFSLVFFPAYALGGDAGLKFASFFTLMMTAVAALHLANRLRVGVSARRIAVALLVLAPLAFQESTVICNDWAVCAWGYAAVALLVAQEPRRWVAGIALGLALGTKYQAMLLVPWVLVLAWGGGEENESTRLSRVRNVALVALTAALIASPFYLRNTIVFGNPFWPLMTNWFGDPHAYVTVMAKTVSQGLAGTYSWQAISSSMREAAFSPLIPATVWLLALGAVCAGAGRSMRAGLGIAAFFGLWWLLQPQMYWRFSVFLLPLAAVLAASAWEQLQKGVWLRWLAHGMVAITLLANLAVLGVYTPGLLTWHVPSLRDRYHHATWYYGEHQWINTNLAKKAKILTLLGSEQTYYLDREYLNADPGMSAEIDWRQVHSAEDLYRELQMRKIDYALLSVNKGCQPLLNGVPIPPLFAQMVASDRAETIWKRERVPLCWQRMQGLYEYDDVWLLKLTSPSRPAAITGRP